MLLMSHMQKQSYRASGNGFTVERGNFDLCQHVLSAFYRVNVHHKICVWFRGNLTDNICMYTCEIFFFLTCADLL